MRVAIGKVALQPQVVAEARRAPAPDPVEALRQRLSGRAARGHVVLDFLADDLRAVHQALGDVQRYVQRIERSVADPALTQQQLLALALGEGPLGQLDHLSERLASARRWLGQVAARM